MRSDFQPGDLLFFSGRNFESRVISFATCSMPQLVRGEWFSHVGIVSVYHGRTFLFESTTLTTSPCAIQCRKVHGPQAHEPTARVREYDGNVWRFRIDPRKRLFEAETQRLTDFLCSKLGDGYDYEGALLSATSKLRLARFIYPSARTLFCSRYAMAALKDIDRVGETVSPHSYNPARMARDLIYWETYQPLGVAGSDSIRLK